MPNDVEIRAAKVSATLAPPAPPRVGRCAFCSDLIPSGYRRCGRCRASAPQLASLTPVALAPSHGTLHGPLRSYKDSSDFDERDKLTTDLACLLWAFLARHQSCIARAADVPAFDIVAVVPSASATRDAARPRLRDATAEIYGTAARLLRPTRSSVTRSRVVDPSLYSVTVNVAGAAVLLIDDTWVTGSRVRSAAHALAAQGAVTVAGVVVGRQVNPNHRDNAYRLAALPRVDLRDCVHCAVPSTTQTSSSHQASTSLR